MISHAESGFAIVVELLVCGRQEHLLEGREEPTFVQLIVQSLGSTRNLAIC